LYEETGLSGMIWGTTRRSFSLEWRPGRPVSVRCSSNECESQGVVLKGRLGNGDLEVNFHQLCNFLQPEQPMSSPQSYTQQFSKAPCWSLVHGWWKWLILTVEATQLVQWTLHALNSRSGHTDTVGQAPLPFWVIILIQFESSLWPSLGLQWGPKPCQCSHSAALISTRLMRLREVFSISGQMGLPAAAVLCFCSSKCWAHPQGIKPKPGKRGC
jgi:hypothetical protein